MVLKWKGNCTGFVSIASYNKGSTVLIIPINGKDMPSASVKVCKIFNQNCRSGHMRAVSFYWLGSFLMSMIILLGGTAMGKYHYVTLEENYPGWIRCFPLSITGCNLASMEYGIQKVLTLLAP